MPNLKDDQSLPALIWRGRLKDGKFDLQAMKGENERLGSSRTNNTINYMQPIVNGLRDGIFDNQAQDTAYLQPQELKPYVTAKSPFLSQSVEDLYPRTYGQTNPLGGSNGEIREVASIGGQPLAITLDINEIPSRLQSENIRSNAKNPLSDAFAAQAQIEKSNDPIKGPLTDIMRYGVEADYEHQAVLKTRAAQGYIQSGIVTKEELDKLHRKINATRDFQSQDVSDMKSLFLSQVGNLGDQGKSVQQQLETIIGKIDNFLPEKKKIPPRSQRS